MLINMRLKWNPPTAFQFIALNRVNPVSCLAASFQNTTHTRSYAGGHSELSSEEREKRKKERYEKRQLRYHTDKEYRERHLQHRRHKWATNSEARDRTLRYWQNKYATDDNYRERAARRNVESWNRQKLIFEKSPEAHDLRRKQVNALSTAMYWKDDDVQYSRKLRARLYSPQFREEVVWKSHEPVVFQTKMDYICSTCGHRRHNGLKIWWKRKGEDQREGGNERQAGEYDCFRCFIADRAASTPIYMPPDMAPLPERGSEKQLKEKTQKGRSEYQPEDETPTGDKSGLAT